MPGRIPPGALLLTWGVPALVILAGVLAADDRTTAAPEAPSQPTSRPSDAEITKARAILAKAIAPPPKLTDAKTKRICELISKLASPVWKIRRAASAELVKSGPEILPILIKFVNHKDLEVSDRISVAIQTIQARVEDLRADLNPAINTLAAGGDKKLICILIRLLDHASTSARCTAEYALRRLTGKNFGFSWSNEPATRAMAVEKWRKWWKDSEAKFAYDPDRIKALSLAFLITSDGAKTVTAVSLDGKIAWSKVMQRTPYCAAGTVNGGFIVGYACGARNVQEHGPQGKLIRAIADLAETATFAVFDATYIPNGNVLIAYPTGCVMEVNAEGKVVWRKSGLKTPASAQRLANGNTLIAEYMGRRVIEVNAKGEIVWQKAGLGNPSDATKLISGNVLIANAQKVTEVNRAGKIVWERHCPSRVTSVCGLPDGTIAITNKAEGAILLGRDRKKIRQLLAYNGNWGKIRLVPASILTRK